MLRLLSKLLLASIGLLSLVTGKLFQAGETSGAEVKPLSTVGTVDLNRYAGRWYEIARLPNFFEKADMQNITADYNLLPSGMVSVRNSSLRASGKKSRAFGVGRSTDKSNAKLKVSFAPAIFRVFPFVWGDYWIVDLDTDYQWALVGEPTRKFLWILSRKPYIAEADFQGLCHKASREGFAVTRLVRPEQAYK